MLRLAAATAAAAVLAVLLNLLVLMTAIGPLGADLLVEIPGTAEAVPLPAANVAALSIGSVALGGVTVALLNRLVANARRVFVVLAVLLVAVSMAPLADPGLTGLDIAVLAFMHVLTGVIAIALLAPLARTSRAD